MEVCNLPDAAKLVGGPVCYDWVQLELVYLYGQLACWLWFKFLGLVIACGNEEEVEYMPCAGFDAIFGHREEGIEPLEALNGCHVVAIWDQEQGYWDYFRGVLECIIPHHR